MSNQSSYFATSLYAIIIFFKTFTKSWKYAIIFMYTLERYFIFEYIIYSPLPISSIWIRVYIYIYIVLLDDYNMVELW